MSAKRSYQIGQIDIITAFLYRSLDKEVFIMQSTFFKDNTAKVCFFRKDLYGLIQAPQVWYYTFLDFVRKLDFYKIEVDYSLFVSAEKIIFITVYVDYLLLFDADIDPWINNIMQNLWDKFWRTNLDVVSHYLGLEVNVDLK